MDIKQLDLTALCSGGVIKVMAISQSKMQTS
jgi:hypothetical protein